MGQISKISKKYVNTIGSVVCCDVVYVCSNIKSNFLRV